MNLGKVPYIHIGNDLTYVFDFASQKHRVSQHNHNQVNYDDTLKYAKKHAAKVFYLHHMKRGRLPQINIKKLNETLYSYEFSGNDYLEIGHININNEDITPEYTQALEYGIVELLKYHKVEGL